MSRSGWCVLLVGLLLGRCPATTPPAVSPSAATAATEVNQLAGRLQRLLPADANLVLSPYSLDAALLTLWLTTPEAASSQFAALLHEQGTLDTACAGRQALAAALPREAWWRFWSSYRWRTGIGFWLDDHGQLDAGFERRLGRLLASDVYVAARQDRLDRWVARQTDGAIRQASQSAGLSNGPPTVVSTALFRDRWVVPFDRHRTSSQPFSRLDGRDVSVPMMRAELTVRYADGDRWQAVELPYQHGDQALLIVLPRTRWAEFAAGFGTAELATVTAALAEQSVTLQLPRFTVSNRLELRGALQQLGLTNVFERRTQSTLPVQPYRWFDHVAGVVQETVLRVHERGTAAAAATAYSYVVDGLSPRSVPMTVDRPFWFGLRHRATGALLFCGRVVDPTTQ